MSFSRENKENIINRYNSFLSVYETSTGAKNKTLSDPKTKDDNKFEATEHLFEAASRMKDAANEMEHCVSVLSNPQTPKSNARATLNDISNTIVPLLSIVSGTLSTTAKKLAPMANMREKHKMEETQRKRDAYKSTSKK